MTEKVATNVFTEEDLLNKIDLVRKAQIEYAKFDQEKIDSIFFEAAVAANKARIPLAKIAVQETGMGLVEDKVIKNHYAAENVYNAYKNTKTIGVIEHDESFGITKIAEPVGVIGAIVPTTNPTSTAIFKALLALKTGNGLIFSPHPRAKNSTIAAAKIVLDAAVKAGAPENIISWIEEPTVPLSAMLMREVDLILATGGPGMVKAAYQSGKPAVGVGAGNTPAIIDSTADIVVAASSLIHSKSFDNGVICASEQSVIVLSDVYDSFKKEMLKRGAYFLNAKEINLVRDIILVNGVLNSKIVGKSAQDIAKLAGFEIPKWVRIIVGEVKSLEKTEPFALEKLSPILTMYKASDFDDAVKKAEKLINDNGLGHTSAIYIRENGNEDKILKWRKAMKTCRCLINTPASQGAIGDIYNFKVSPSLTLGCGSWGGNSVSENVGVKHLINIKTIAERRENMLWFRSPEKVYFKRGCLPVALRELKEVFDKKRAVVVTDKFLFESGFTKNLTNILDDLNIIHTVFFNVTPDPTLACAKEGAKLLTDFKPDVIIALGGGSPIDAAKIMWALYEYPDIKFSDLAMRFMDIRKRVNPVPKLGKKAYFVAIPTTAGTGSEVTPFAVITDEKDSTKYPIADYELMPNMAIVDADLMMNIPKGLTAAAGIDALTHVLEATVSMLATDYTNAIAKEAVINIFEYLPRAYKNGCNDPIAREKMANASCMAGMAFANAFLGICHSMAHKLGSYHHIPHGVANALLISEVIRYNSVDAPEKMGTFPQYEFPNAKQRYALLADLLSLGGKTVDEKIEKLIEKIEELKADINIPKSIKDAGISESEFYANLDKMSEDAFDDQCTGSNPRYPLIRDIKDIYIKAYHGKKVN